MITIIGLGNPGKTYEQTRHNFGFRVLDLLANGEEWQDKYDAKFIKLEDVILAKPQTFMNKSGEAVKEISKFYPASKLVVAHDDLDLPLGAIRIQKNSSSAGHNGVQSIVDELGTQDFIRLRLGIQIPRFVDSQIPAEDFVLQKFTSDEEKIVIEILEKAKAAIEMLQTDGLELAQSRYNG
jgi:PTH1 family peptidyl-tRNA hydrolase